ncbi:hypothetical protein [Pontibacter indicus]|uniref:Uncharacterized protein n=1 Tax=Pontibacter indicus TaxID=1317125 RepID=A0A1R3WHT1_9BACT|nr:hypothetical protein [Pontibacter indicus]SIT77487.1 hypothetical protein SAMN05444128_0496 [Pontibacter indicus]
MDTSTIVMGILALALFVVPIYYIQQKQKSKLNKAKQPFLDAAQRHGLQLGKYDFWNEQYGIGLDETESRLFYWHNETGIPQEMITELSSVKQSIVDSAYRENNGNRIFDAIGLRLMLQGAKESSVYLPFYLTKDIMMLKGELKLAEEWNAIIQHNISSRKAVQV